MRRETAQCSSPSLTRVRNRFIGLPGGSISIGFYGALSYNRHVSKSKRSKTASACNPDHKWACFRSTLRSECRPLERPILPGKVAGQPGGYLVPTTTTQYHIRPVGRC